MNVSYLGRLTCDLNNNRGYADLVKAFPFFGDTQLKVLCVIAAIVLALADAITCYSVSEKILTKEPE